jgi:hypothetical protein
VYLSVQARRAYSNERAPPAKKRRVMRPGDSLQATAEELEEELGNEVSRSLDAVLARTTHTATHNTQTASEDDEDGLANIRKLLSSKKKLSQTQTTAILMQMVEAQTKQVWEGGRARDRQIERDRDRQSESERERESHHVNHPPRRPRFGDNNNQRRAAGLPKR